MAILAWRKQPNETGLAAVGQRPRGLELRYGGDHIASVSPVAGKTRWDVTGWYFVARADKYGVQWMNTYGKKHWDTQADAKAACDQYVRKHFKAITEQKEGE